MSTLTSRYKLEKKIPTIDVNVDLLQSIEDYLITTIPNLFDLTSEEIRSVYTTDIKVVNGKFSFGLIKEFNSTMFPDTVQSIVVGFRTNPYTSKPFNIDFQIRFSIEELSSYIEISILDTNPEEKAHGILNNIESIINKKKNLNYLFHPSILVKSILAALAYGIPVMSTVIFKDREKPIFASILLGLMIGAYLSLFKHWKPYVAFDTNKQKLNNSIANYILLGILTFVIFGSGAMLIRKYFIGL